MELGEALHNNRYKIVDRWVEYTLSTYESSSFFKKEKDAFANPIGGTVRSALKELFPLFRKAEMLQSIRDLYPRSCIFVQFRNSPLRRRLHL